jgi:nitrogen-specific signal transduction histidine kinase
MMSLKIIQEHKGEIIFHSKEGNGTVVEVLMPMNKKKKPTFVK